MIWGDKPFANKNKYQTVEWLQGLVNVSIQSSQAMLLMNRKQI